MHPATSATATRIVRGISPSVARMAYVSPAHSSLGTPLDVDIRGTPTPATVVPLPFYKRKK